MLFNSLVSSLISVKSCLLHFKGFSTIFKTSFNHLDYFFYYTTNKFTGKRGNKKSYNNSISTKSFTYLKRVLRPFETPTAVSTLADKSKLNPVLKIIQVIHKF